MKPRAFTIVEMLVYIGMLSIVLGLGYGGYQRGQRNAVLLRRNVNDMARALDAGERWRADLRRATAMPRVVQTASRAEMRIPQPAGTVVYFLENGTVWRQKANAVAADAFLSGVQASRMMMDRASSVTSWRWEVELRSDPKAVRIRPLFTFQAVPSVKR